MKCPNCGKRWRCKGYNECENRGSEDCKCDDCYNEQVFEALPYKCNEDKSFNSKEIVIFT